MLADIDFFPFPTLTEANGQDAVEAPIDGFMLSKKGGDDAVAKAFAAFIGSAAGQNAYQAVDSSNIATNKMADTSKYSALTKKGQAMIAGAKNISQFLDRDRCRRSPTTSWSRPLIVHQVRKLQRQERRGAGQEPVLGPVATTGLDHQPYVRVE